MNFAKWVFRVCGIYGLVALTPLYFMEQRLGADQPPVINHPEYYYGFAIPMRQSVIGQQGRMPTIY